ncbi:MAG: bifunctional hydroxymethylpyrimidine kinase/phosphomethylpyrimidine kinase [Sorangium cellulosum]|nr:MAG: bifunctional hydroxymethylpyrimidine kinase/phosphomethylpyrimidine kinase [Sorangium cellulosum]
MNHSINECVLILAGLDPSGGAGISADQRAVLAAGAWPCPVAVVSTVQSTMGLESVQQVDPKLVLAQAKRLLDHQNICVIKTGALGSHEGVDVVLRLVDACDLPVIVDPVSTASRGQATLSNGDPRDLASRATLFTPNALEASALCGSKVRDLADQREAARSLLSLGSHAVLVKGGHVDGAQCVDVLALGTKVVEFSSARRRAAQVHGTGCLLASLIAGRLAINAPGQGRQVSEKVLVQAIGFSRRRLGQAIAKAQCIGEGQLVARV